MEVAPPWTLSLTPPVTTSYAVRMEWSKDQLVAVGLSESQALQVIAHREKSGPLLQVEELLAVQQMKKDTFEKVRNRVTVDE